MSKISLHKFKIKAMKGLHLKKKLVMLADGKKDEIDWRIVMDGGEKIDLSPIKQACPKPGFKGYCQTKNKDNCKKLVIVVENQYHEEMKNFLSKLESITVGDKGKLLTLVSSKPKFGGQFFVTNFYIKSTVKPTGSEESLLKDQGNHNEFAVMLNDLNKKHQDLEKKVNTVLETSTGLEKTEAELAKLKKWTEMGLISEEECSLKRRKLLGI